MLEQIKAIKSERVDDLPLLLAVIQQMGIIEIFNEEVAQHGNWQGMGAGYLIAVWLAYILSEGDHRKCYLQQWVAEREHTLRHCLAVEAVRELDFSDDRLGLLLDKLSDDATWQRGERAVNQRLMRVYKLEGSVARLDTTSASSYGQVDEGGLLQFGYSKDHRPDLAQVKIATLTLDPLGMPLVTLPVAGNVADDGVYLPLIAEARHTLGAQRGVLYVGDSKMGALATRREIAAQEDYYLMPLSKVQLSHEQLLDYLDEHKHPAAAPHRREVLQDVDENGRAQILAEGFTVTLPLTDRRPATQQPFTWSERRFLVRAPRYAAQQQAAFAQRLAAAESALRQLVVRRGGYAYPATHHDLEQRIAETLRAHDCEAYLTVTIHSVNIYQRLRAYGQRPARTERQTVWALSLTRHEAAITQACRLLGWRAYATNAPAAQLSFATAVEVYRDAYLHEHGYSRLKGKPLALTPLYLHKETQILGLIRLLSLALRVLTLIEYVVRQQLAAQATTLSGIYAGNKGRRSATPRTETLLRVFKGITLTIILQGNQQWCHLTPLTATQQRILQLLHLSDHLYTTLVSQSPKVVHKSAN